MAKKIAFIRKTLVPLASVNLRAALQEQFPEFDVELIDITQIIKKRIDILVVNTLYTLMEYGWVLMHRKRKFRECFFGTRYLFHKIKELMAERLSIDEYLFSVQMQSLYDASKAGLPNFVYTDHTFLANLTYPDYDRSAFYPDWLINLERQIYANATIVFTRSSNITCSLIEQYGCPQEKVVSVYAGSNLKEVHVPDEKEYTNKNILFVGIDWRRKGGPELVEAFKQVLKVHPDAQLTIVGCSPKIDVPNCQVVGRIPLDQLNEYYEHASIFCLPTKLEPFGIAFIEALSFKLPIVATNIGAIPDFVLNNQNGYLVSPGCVNELTCALNKLLDSPETCKEFGQRGYTYVKDKYTWENTGSLMKEHILAALHRQA